MTQNQNRHRTGGQNGKRPSKTGQPLETKTPSASSCRMVKSTAVVPGTKKATPVLKSGVTSTGRVNGLNKGESAIPASVTNLPWLSKIVKMAKTPMGTFALTTAAPAVRGPKAAVWRKSDPRGERTRLKLLRHRGSKSVPPSPRRLPD